MKILLEKMKWIFLIILLVLLSKKLEAAPFSNLLKCELIKEPFCSPIYNMTSMPNLINSQNQEEASKIIKEFFPMKNSGCSQYFDYFLCSFLFPICHNNQIKQPCREFCYFIQHKCAITMEQYLMVKWSSYFNCDKLPNHKSGDSCLYVPGVDMAIPKQKTGAEISKKIPEKIQFCLPYEVNIANKPNITCLQRCGSHLRFSKQNKQFTKYWLVVWSVLCLLSSFLTIIVFSCNSSRFRYPEKPILFISICYFFYSISSLFSVILGREMITCNKYELLADEFIITTGHTSIWCSINFIVNYYFNFASNLWWLILTFTWYLSTNKQWGNEALESLSNFLHLVCWFVPLIYVIVAKVLQLIDTDELTGLCGIGNDNSLALLIFVIIPQSFTLVVGIIFLIIGYSSLWKVRKSFLNEPDRLYINNLKRMEKLMAKIGVYSILYIIPALCLLVSYILDISIIKYLRELMLAVFQQKSFSQCFTDKGLVWHDQKCMDLIEPHLPSVELRILRIFMNLVIGLISGVWIWGNLKTIKTCKSLKSPKKSDKRKLSSKFPDKLNTSVLSSTHNSNQQTSPQPPLSSLGSFNSPTISPVGVFQINTPLLQDPNDSATSRH